MIEEFGVCKFYRVGYNGRPLCIKDRSRHAGLRCHAKRDDCPRYQPSESSFDDKAIGRNLAEPGQKILGALLSNREEAVWLVKETTIF